MSTDIGSQGGMLGDDDGDDAAFLPDEQEVQEEASGAVFGPQPVFDEEQGQYVEADEYDDDDSDGEEYVDAPDWMVEMAEGDEETLDFLVEKNFSTPREALRSLRELQGFSDSQGNDVGSLRQEVANLKAELQQKQQANPVEIDADEQERQNIVRNATELRRLYAEQFENGEIDSSQFTNAIASIEEIVTEDKLKKMEQKFESKFDELSSSTSTMRAQEELNDAAIEIADKLGPDVYEQYRAPAMQWIEDYVANNPGTKPTGDLLERAFGQVAIDQTAQAARRRAARVTGEGAASSSSMPSGPSPEQMLKRAIRGGGSGRSSGGIL